MSDRMWTGGQRALVLAALFALAPAAGRAQQPAAGPAAGPVRGALGWHAGVVVHGTGDYNCETAQGFAAGAEVRTRGAWLLAAGADVLVTSALTCTSMLKLVLHGGRFVEEHAHRHYVGGPRLGVRAGRAFAAGAVLLEPAVGGGLALGRQGFHAGTELLWRPWAAGSLTARRARGRGGFQLEAGRHAVPVRYHDDGAIVHEFDRWEPAFRLSITF
jgi:hypothetical protein